MGYKIYGEEEARQPRWKEYIEWFVVTLLWFPYAIGGWLVHFGMPAAWMAALSLCIALAAAWRLSGR